MDNCIFCEIIKSVNLDDVIFQNERLLIMLDADLAVKGHTMVIWKEHFENASDLSQEEFAEFSEAVRKTEKILLEELQLDKSVILKSGGLVSHFHFHIYPIPKDTSWEEVKNIFDKKVKYEYKGGEKNSLLVNLKKDFTL